MFHDLVSEARHRARPGSVRSAPVSYTHLDVYKRQANDKPVLAFYKGELLMPALIDYPEEKFGGFYAVTDYRDPVISDEIEANGWLIWPPIRYSYRTVNNDIPEAAPAKPSWLYDKEFRCQRYVEGVNDPNCTIGNLSLIHI